MRHLVFFCILSLTAFAGWSQTREIDSLYEAERNSQDTGEKINLLHQIVSATWDYDFDKALKAAEAELALAQKTGDPESLLIALTDVGMYYYFTGNYPESERYYQAAIRAGGNKNYGEYPAYTLTRMANLHRVQGTFDSATFYYNKSQESLRNVPPGIAQASLYFHRGWMHYDLSQFDIALPYLYRARNIRYALGDSLLIAECWRVIGMVHVGLNRYDSADYYLEKTSGIAFRFKDTELTILTEINKGELWQTRGDLLQATYAYERALALLEQHNFKRYHALVIFRIGQVFDFQENYLKAIDYYLAALKINQELNAQQEMARIFWRLAWTYHALNNQTLAMDYADRSQVLMKKINDQAGLSFVYNLRGRMASSQKKLDVALAYYDSALVLRKRMGLEVYISNTLSNMAMVYQQQGRYDKAIENLLQNLDLSTRLKDEFTQAMALNALGYTYGLNREFSSALSSLNRASELARRTGVMSILQDTHFSFAKVYTLMGKPEKAIGYYEQYIALNESLVSRENTNAVLQLNALYRLEEKENEIRALNQENELKQSQIQVQQSKIHSRNLILLFSVVALLLLATGGFILFLYYRTKSRAHGELLKLNNDILEKKEEIQAQAEELIEANQALSKLNFQLIEKQEEIEAQSEELREANEMISEINRGLEQTVDKRTSQLTEAYKELDTFFYRSSHDFRRPLTTFLGLAEVAKITVKDTNALELFEKVKDTATNLDKMLFKLQSISNVGAQQLIYKEVFIKEICSTIFDSFRNELERKDIRVQYQVTLKRVFFSYPAMISLILENLIENSINFSMRNNPFVSVQVLEREGHVVMEISDNGEGIDPKYHDRIFEMYFRGNEKSKGNGLGLYIVKKAVEKLNGSISFRSGLGEGVTFTVILPFGS